MLTLHLSEEASEEFSRADAIDPFSGQSHVNKAYLLFNARRYLEAIRAAKKSGDDPVSAMSFAELGHREDALAAADRAVKTARHPVVLAQIASAHALAGNKTKAATMLTGIEAQERERYVCGFNVACVYAAMGNKEGAFSWLAKAYRDRSD